MPTFPSFPDSQGIPRSTFGYTPPPRTPILEDSAPLPSPPETQDGEEQHRNTHSTECSHDPVCFPSPNCPDSTASTNREPEGSVTRARLVEYVHSGRSRPARADLHSLSSGRRRRRRRSPSFLVHGHLQSRAQQRQPSWKIQGMRKDDPETSNPMIPLLSPAVACAAVSGATAAAESPKTSGSTVQALLSFVNRFLLPPDTNTKRMQLSLGFRQRLVPSVAGIRPLGHQTGVLAPRALPNINTDIHLP